MFVFISWKKQVKMLVVISWLVSFGVCIHIYFCDAWEYRIELLKRRSKVQEKNVSCERGLNFDEWKTFSENYKSMRVWLWTVYKFTENNCRWRLFSEFIQTRSTYLFKLPPLTKCVF